MGAIRPLTGRTCPLAPFRTAPGCGQNEPIIQQSLVTATGGEIDITSTIAVSVVKFTSVYARANVT